MTGENSVIQYEIRRENMKILHLADLHIGKKYETVELLDDQREVLKEILDIIGEQKPDALVIAGDVYDRSVPPEQAMKLFDEFTDELADLPVLVISGNHDSGIRVAQWSGKLAKQQIYLAGTYDGALKPVELGDTAFYLMPYLDPVEVRRVQGRDDLHTMEDAVRAVLETRVETDCRYKVLVAHLFAAPLGHVGDMERSDSEREPVGGLDNVDVALFDGFDYVALGHLHGPQRVGSERVRYAGSPLMYSFSESRQQKSVTLVTLEDGETRVELIPLHSGRKMRVKRGKLEELLLERPSEEERRDFILAELTDDEIREDAAQRLQSLYDHVQVRYIGIRTETDENWSLDEGKLDDPIRLFEDFFMQRNGKEMTDKQREVVIRLLEEAEQ